MPKLPKAAAKKNIIPSEILSEPELVDLILSQSMIRKERRLIRRNGIKK